MAIEIPAATAAAVPTQTTARVDARITLSRLDFCFALDLLAVIDPGGFDNASLAKHSL